MALPEYRRRLPRKVSRPRPPSSQNFSELGGECGWLGCIAYVVTWEVHHLCAEPLGQPGCRTISRLSGKLFAGVLPTREHDTILVRGKSREVRNVVGERP